MALSLSWMHRNKGRPDNRARDERRGGVRSIPRS